MPRLELINMAREFKLDVDGCNTWWLYVNSESKGLREIKNDLDALTMANNINSSRKVCVCVRIATSEGDHSVGIGDNGGGNDHDVGETKIDKVENEQEEEEEA